MCCWCGSPMRDAQGLEVEALLVAHLEAADRARPDVAAGERGLVDDQQGVGVVAVVGAGALDEAVVEVVEHGRRQDAVQPVDAGLLVVLVLVAAPAGDLDDDLDDAGEGGRRGGCSWRDSTAHPDVRERDRRRQRRSAPVRGDGRGPRRPRAMQGGGEDRSERTRTCVSEDRSRQRRSAPDQARPASRCRGAPRSASPAPSARSGRSRRTRSASRTPGPPRPGRRGSSPPRRSPSRGSAAPGTG